MQPSLLQGRRFLCFIHPVVTKFFLVWTLGCYYKSANQKSQDQKRARATPCSRGSLSTTISHLTHLPRPFPTRLNRGTQSSRLSPLRWEHRFYLLTQPKSQYYQQLHLWRVLPKPKSEGQNQPCNLPGQALTHANTRRQRDTINRWPIQATSNCVATPEHQLWVGDRHTGVLGCLLRQSLGIKRK